MSLNLPSQLLLQQDLPENALLINPPQDDLGLGIPESWAIASFSFAVHQQYEKTGFATESILAIPEQKFESIYIFLPKAKARLQYILDYATDALANDGELFFIGENKGGIKSLAKNLKKQFSYVEKVTSGKHSAIICASNPSVETQFNLEDYFSEHENHVDLDLRALPGVFSQDKLDKGTKVLLDNLPRKIKGRILDFGCGAGTIGIYLSQHREFEELELIDDDMLAVYSAQKNIERNKVPYTEAFLSNGLTEVEDRYNWIISNPPFHQGVKTHYNVTETFLKEAKNYLKLSGKLLLVANEFLNYEVILREHFKSVTTLVTENGFKVIQCEGIMRK